MNLQDAIVFDLETTGKDVATDQIVEISIKKGKKNHVWRVKPLIAISKGAQEVHGISAEDVQNEPTFKEIGKKVRKILDENKIWMGYNLDFDINIMQSELKRNGLHEIDLSDKVIIDGYKLWRQMEPRSLEHAYKRFVGKTLEGAHDAAVDTEATAEVVEAMVADYGLQDKSIEELALICEPERKLWIGPSRHIQWNKEGTPIIAFGNKHSEKPLMEVVKERGGDGYLNWVMTSNFPSHVRLICHTVLLTAREGQGEEKLVPWLEETFGPRPSV